jgi:PKD repeat protein
LTLLVCAALLYGCSGKRADSPQSVAANVEVASEGLPALPAPASLFEPASRSGSFTEADVFHHGSEFDPTLPNNLVTVQDNSALFDGESALPKLTGVSYGIYRFALSGYDRNAAVYAEWSPADAANTYFALANWSKDRWQWFKSAAEGGLQLGSMDPYLHEDGTMLVAVLVLGDDLARLDSLRAGSQPPVASLQIEPPSGFVPYELSLDASASSDPDGTIVRYEWDLNNNGVFELETGSDATPPAQTIDDAGSHTIALKVTDNDGVQNVTTVTFQAYGEWLHSWGGEKDDSFAAIISDAEGSLYACGQTSSFGSGGADALLIKFRADGSVEWARTWGTDEHEYGVALVHDGSGNFLQLVNSASISSCLLIWTPEGELIRSRRVASGDAMASWAMSTLNGTVYIVAGGLFGPESTDVPTLYAYDIDGGLLWFKQFAFDGDPLGARLQDIGSFAGFAVDSSAIYCAGTGDDHVVLLQCDINGALQESVRLDWAETSFSPSIEVSGVFTPIVHVAGSLLEADQVRFSSFIAQYGPASPYSLIWTTNSGDSIMEDFSMGGIRLYFCGRDYPVGNTTYLWGIEGSNFVENEALSAPASLFQPAALTPLGDTALAACGYCKSVLEGEFSETEIEIVPGSLNWQSFGVVEIEAAEVTDGDFSGTITNPEGAVIDDPEPGLLDALLLMHELPPAS